MYGRKAWAVVAYTYDADIHCPHCASDRFAGRLAAWESGETDVAPTDSEGNPVNVVFSSDYDGTYHCGTCHDPID